jgi:PelA/Pel-15E family pectate lyase
MNNFITKKAVQTGLFLCAAAVVLATVPESRYRQKDDAWFGSPEGLEKTRNILSWQTPQGTWPKNVDTSKAAYTGDPNTLHGIFDNGATISEMRFLARAYTIVKDEKYKLAFIKALDLILKAQYPSGGWPQSYPPDDQYHRYITFNDGAMTRIMEMLRDVITMPDTYGFVDAVHQKAVKAVFAKGLDCILKCQIKVNGKLTVWCAQHDPVDYSPKQGRSYELPSLSGAESAGIVCFLMSLDNPAPPVKDAIESAVKWFETSRVEGIRVTKIEGNRTAVQDPNASTLWARFYEIETNKPIFSDRDGIKKYNFNDIGTGRRNGYAWYGDWGQNVAEAYKKWLEKKKANSK